MISKKSVRKRVWALRTRFRRLKNRDRLHKKILPTGANQGNELRLLPYINVWESELQFMASLTTLWGNVETGGDVYGYFSHAGRLTVVFIIPPGKNAIHDYMHYRQDTDFLKKIDYYLRSKYSVYYIGSMHSHHILLKKDLSDRDIYSTNIIARKNGYHRLCQFLTTFENNRTLYNHQHTYPRHHEKQGQEGLKRTTTSAVKDSKGCERSTDNSSSTFSGEFVKVHSYYYDDAAYDRPKRCSINVIPGISPIRKAIMKDPELPELKDVAMPFNFSMSHIIFDSVQPEAKSSQEISKRELSVQLSDQLLDLPENVRNEVRVCFRENMILLSLPVSNSNSMVMVAYHDKPTCELKGVYFKPTRPSSPLIDYTAYFCFTRFNNDMSAIYNRVLILAAKKKKVKYF